MKPVAVIDLGKTNAKLALVDPVTLSELAVVTRPNSVCPGPPWPHFDLEGHWRFFLQHLAGFQKCHGVGAISVTTHGAAAVLLAENGTLAAPMLDYEHDGPDRLAADYDRLRPPFAETGSPRLPLGLNLGAQFHWQFATDPGLRERVAHIVTYPQYWGFRLTGALACDLSSLGCHTDLFEPQNGRLSALAARLGIAGKLAPPRPATGLLGPVLPGIAAETGLDRATMVAIGIHDSNASLLAHLIRRAPPFSVVSTGTWVISMAVGGAQVAPDPARDTLVNVSAMGAAVPSARFMGGREHDLALPGAHAAPTGEDRDALLASGTMLLPALAPESGPFPGRAARWAGGEPAIGSGARRLAVAWYLALTTAECLRLIGHRGPAIVEGPFARNADYLAMLAEAAEGPVIASASATGTSAGAALLVTEGKAPPLPPEVPVLPAGDPVLRAYIARWRAAL